MRKNLTDAAVKAIKPQAARYDIWDTSRGSPPGFGIRVGPANTRGQFSASYVLAARYPRDPSKATRRAVARVGAISLADARQKANEWVNLIARGIDPADEEDKARRAEQARRDTTFGAVALEYLRSKVIGPEADLPMRDRVSPPLQRNGLDVERAIRKEFIERWNDRPITDIRASDVRAVIDEKIDEGSRWRAHSLLTFATTLFNWLLADDEDGDKYGLVANPCARIDREKVIGKREGRDRTLEDWEIVELWKASKKIGYPYGPVYQLLALTGARRSEIAEARWSELDSELVRLIAEADAPIEWAKVPARIKLLSIPRERMKANQAHLIPLSDPALEIIASLPRIAEPKGDHLFSTTLGEKPIDGFSKAAHRLRREMLSALRKAEEERGGDPDQVALEPFVLHDIRRTVRTRLSKLKVPSDIAELVIGHTLQGLRKIYDRHDFLDEKRDALVRWAATLVAIVTPPPDNVVQLADHSQAVNS